jgi:hypothetical protein
VTGISAALVDYDDDVDGFVDDGGIVVAAAWGG